MNNKIGLREISINDTKKIVEWRNKKFVRYNLFNHNLINYKNHIYWLNNVIKSGLGVQFIIFIKDTKKDIGTVFLKNINKKNKEAEFGIFIGEQEELGKGYGTDATRLILDYGFRILKLKKIYLKVFINNLSAIRSYKKVGFIVESIENLSKDNDISKNKISIMSILIKDWRNQKK